MKIISSSRCNLLTWFLAVLSPCMTLPSFEDYRHFKIIDYLLLTTHIVLIISLHFLMSEFPFRGLQSFCSKLEKITLKQEFVSESKNLFLRLTWNLSKSCLLFIFLDGPVVGKLKCAYRSITQHLGCIF